MFLAMYFLIYGGMNAVFWLQIRKACALATTGTVGVSLWLLLMIFAPFLTRLLIRYDWLQIASLSAYVGFTWMGLVFSFLILTAILYLLMIPVSLVGACFKRPVGLDVVARPIFWIGCVYMAVVFVVGYLHADQLETVELEVPLNRAIQQFQPVRIVQISDVHLGLTTINQRIRTLTQTAKSLRPDLLVVTGDLIDGPMSPEQEETLAAWFREIEAPLGRFFILGNHEMYEGIKHSERFAKAAGLRLLRNEIVQVTDWLEVAGIDDPTLLERSGQKTLRDVELLPTRSAERARLYLKHRPIVEAEAVDRFDLQLSGHTHSGQIFPFKYVTEKFTSHPCGLHRVGSAWFYHSRGSGTWGPPIRFMNPPEVTLLHLTRASETAAIAAD